MNTDSFAAALYGSPALPSTGEETLIDGGTATAPKPAPVANPPANMASALYPEANDGAPAPVEPTKARDPEHPIDKIERQSEAMYADGEPITLDVPDNIKALREADELRAIYGAQGQFSQAMPDTILDEVDNAAALAPEMRQAVVTEVREMATDLGMSVADITNLKSLGNVFEAPTNEQISDWQSQAIDGLKREYGDDWKKALEDANSLIKRDPRLKVLMNQNGRGNHPAVVSMFAKLGRQARVAGRLK